MAEALLIGAGVGAGTSLMSGQDPLKGAVLGGAMGGATAGFGGAGVASGAGGAGASAGSNSMMTTLAEQGATNAVTPTLAGIQEQILSEVPQSAFNNSSLPTQDFIGSHLTSDVNSQGLMNNYSGFTDGVPDPMQAYPDFNNPVSSTPGELANADGGYGGSIFDGMGGMTDKLSDFTGMDRGDVSSMALNQGANLLQPTPEEKIKHTPMGTGISRPQVDLSKSPGILFSSNPLTSGAGGQQLTPEQIKLLQQKGIL